MSRAIPVITHVLFILMFVAFLGTAVPWMTSPFFEHVYRMPKATRLLLDIQRFVAGNALLFALGSVIFGYIEFRLAGRLHDQNRDRIFHGLTLSMAVILFGFVIWATYAASLLIDQVMK